MNEGNSKALKKGMNTYSKLNYIESIIKNNGSQSENTDEIIETFRKHFELRYQNEEVDETKQANLIASFATENHLKYSEKNFLSKPFEPSEFRNAIKKLNPNGATDGLSSNLYKSFSKLYSKILCSLLNNTLENGNLPRSFKLAILKLIPKIDSPVLPDDFRPISLINADQKIVSHVLCERLTNILGKTIQANQYAYVPKRNMHSAVHYVRLRIKNLKQKSQFRRCTVSLDFSKAFDRIDRRYIVKLLSAVGIPDNFVL